MKKDAPESTPFKFLNKQGKDTERKTQPQLFYDFLQKNIATCSMVCEATGLKQKCCTRYKRKLEKNGYLWELYDSKCQATGFKAAYLTTDPKKLRRGTCIQLKLF